MTKKSKTGRELEQYVANAYHQMGARKVEHDVELAGHQIDIYVEVEAAGLGLHRIAVEAKDYARPVGIMVVNDFAQIVGLLRRKRLIDEGIIVSSAGFSKQARNAARSHDIGLLEPEDLDKMATGRRIWVWKRSDYISLRPPIIIGGEERTITESMEGRWPAWEASLREALRNAGAVNQDTALEIPASLLQASLERYFDLYSEREALTLRKDSLLLTTADRTRAWLAAWDSLVTTLTETGTLPVTTQFDTLAVPLIRALGLHRLGTRSLGGLHAVVVDAPALRLKIPLRFPLVFVEPSAIRPGIRKTLTGLSRALDLGEFFALVIPFEEPATSETNADRLKSLLRTSPYAHDFIVLSHEDILTLLSAREPTARLAECILDQVDLTAVSPFVTSGPVPDRMFFGRDQEIKTITQALPHTDFALVGNRKIGKTSLLQRIERILKSSDECVPVPLNFQAVRDYITLYDMLAQEVGFAADNATPHNFLDLIVHLRRQHPDKTPVLLIDEVDNLLAFDTQRGHRLGTVWRALAFEKDCRFVFVGSRVLAQARRNADSPFFNFAQEIRLGFLLPAKARAVVSGPMDDLGIGLEPRQPLIDRILDLSSCHPNLVQYICAQLIELISARGERRVLMSDLVEVTISGEFADYYLDTLWGQAEPLERAITILGTPTGFTMTDMEVALKECGFDAPRHAVKDALDMLTVYSVLTRRERSTYSFVPTSFPRILRETQDVDYLLQDSRRRWVKTTRKGEY